MHFGIGETLVVVIFLDNLLGAIGDVLGELVSLHEAETQLDVLFFPFFHAIVADFADARLLAQADFEPRFFAANFLHLDLHLGEKPLAPESFGGISDVAAGDFDFFAHRQTGISDNNIVFVVVCAGNFNACDFIGLGHTGIDDIGIVDCVVSHVGCHKRAAGEERGKYQ